MKAWICDIKRFAVHDGDGIRTTVFFKGCPMKCVWCHNPESISFKPQIAYYEGKCIGCGECEEEGFTPENCLGEAKVLYGREMSVTQLLPLLLEDKDFYETSGGGVTLSGGECLCQADFCAALLKELKAEGIRTAVDTCGFVPREAIDKVLPYTDIFLYDIKAMEESVHIKCTGRPNRQILENLQYLDSCGKAVEVRIPFVPGWNDDQMEKIAVFLRPLGNVRAVKVLPYHNYAGSKYAALGMENTLPGTLPTTGQIEEAEKRIQKVFESRMACRDAELPEKEQDPSRLDSVTALWCEKARELGFSDAAPMDPAKLTVRGDVRAMCAENKCGAYGRNWTCPPHCGTLDDCAARIGGYSRGILLQTVEKLEKTIDTKGYRRAEERHLRQFHAFAESIREVYPEALCLGAGGCRVCSKCAFPEPCRFPEKAYSSMEGYGLFVTQVCRDNGIAYHHGERTVTFTACVLF